MSIILDEKAFRVWIKRQILPRIQPTCEADIKMAIDYMVVVLQNHPVRDITNKMYPKLHDFLGEDTRGFIKVLIEALKTKSYMNPSPEHKDNEMDSDTTNDDVSSTSTTAHSKKDAEPDKRAVSKEKKLNLQIAEDEEEPAKSAVKASVTSRHSQDGSKVQRKRNSGRRSVERERNKRGEHKKSRLGTEQEKRDTHSKLQVTNLKSRSHSKSSHADSSDEEHTTRHPSLSSESPSSPRRSWARNNRRKNRSPHLYPRGSKPAARSKRSRSVDRIRSAVSRAAPSHDAEYRQSKKRRGGSNGRNSSRSSAVRTTSKAEEIYQEQKKVICNEFNALGFCVRGELCSFDHGGTATLVESGCLYRGDVGQPRTVYVSTEPRFSQQVAGLQSFLRMQSYCDPQFPQYQPPINPYPYPQAHNAGVPFGPFGNVPFEFPGMQRPLNPLCPAPPMNSAQGQMVPYGPQLPPTYGHISSSYDTDAGRCTILLQNVPQHLSSIPALYEHFMRHGNITLIQVMRNNDPREALLSFSNATVASRAMNSIRSTNVDGIEVVWFKDKCILEQQGRSKQSWAPNRGRGTNRRRSNRNVVVLEAGNSPVEQQEDPELTGQDVNKEIATGVTSVSFPEKKELIKRLQNRVLTFSIYLKGVETEQNLESKELIKGIIKPLQDDGKSQQEIEKALSAIQKEYLKLIMALKDGNKLTEEQQLLVESFLSKSATPPPDLSERSGYNPPPNEMGYRQSPPTYRRHIVNTPCIYYYGKPLTPMEDITITLTDSDDDIIGFGSGGNTDLAVEKEKVDIKDEKDTSTVSASSRESDGVADKVTDRDGAMTYAIDTAAEPTVENNQTFQDQDSEKDQPTPEIKKENVAVPQAVQPQRSEDNSPFQPYRESSYNFGYFPRYAARSYWRSSRARRGYRGWRGGKNPYKVDHTREGQ